MDTSSSIIKLEILWKSTVWVAFMCRINSLPKGWKVAIVKWVSKGITSSRSSSWVSRTFLDNLNLRSITSWTWFFLVGICVLKCLSLKWSSKDRLLSTYYYMLGIELSSIQRSWCIFNSLLGFRLWVKGYFRLVWFLWWISLSCSSSLIVINYLFHFLLWFNLWFEILLINV